MITIKRFTWRSSNVLLSNSITCWMNTVGGRVYVCVSFSSFSSLLKRTTQQQKEDKWREWNNTNEDNHTREKTAYIYIYMLKLYIRNNNHRDYQSRADSVKYKQGRIKEEEKEKVGHNEKDI
jgi:hypothetical protein